MGGGVDAVGCVRTVAVGREIAQRWLAALCSPDGDYGQTTC